MFFDFLLFTWGSSNLLLKNSDFLFAFFCAFFSVKIIEPIGGLFSLLFGGFGKKNFFEDVSLLELFNCDSLSGGSLKLIKFLCCLRFS